MSNRDGTLFLLSVRWWWWVIIEKNPRIRLCSEFEEAKLLVDFHVPMAEFEPWEFLVRTHGDRD
jgi:hypothetical protein